MALAAAAPELRRPFAPEAIKFRLGGGGVLPYIDARVVIERLNAVVPGLWSTRFEPYPGGKQIICHLTIDDVTRSDVGSQSQGQHVDPVKGGYSDALKRAAVHFGVGVSVYALARVSVDKLPEGSIREVGQKRTKVLTTKGEAHLRGQYKKWLESKAGRHFGEPLSHGDVEDAIGDVEAAPSDEPGGSEPVEQPTLEDEAEIANVKALYARIDGRRLPKAKFTAQLRAAAGDPEKLAKLRAKLEELAA